MSEMERVKQDDRAHVFHSWSAQRTLNPVAIAGGEGSTFWDYEGNRYLDFGSQLVNLNLGFGHPKVVGAIQRQASILCTVAPSFAESAKSAAARLIAEVAPRDMDVVFFTTGGGEANENAVRMARLATGRHKILAAYRSYHGATAGAITLSGNPRRWPSEPGMPGVVHFFGPYPYRSSFHAQTEAEEGERALAHLEEVIELEGPKTIAAIILEPVVGANGILVPPDGYLQGVRAICDRHGIVMIVDEVMTGFGRCGEWFAVDAWDVVPDLITFAKGVNSGYVPLGGVILGRDIADAFADVPFPGGLTYSGHALACAAAVATIEALRDEDIVKSVHRMGEDVLGPGLRELQERHPSIGEVRGLGAFWAMELVKDRGTREMFVPFNASGSDAAPMQAIVDACRQRGLWPFVHFNRIHAMPPLTTPFDEVRRGLEILDDALDVADRMLEN